MRFPRSQAGFTLLEMLGATALLAIALGILLTGMGQSMQMLAKDEVKNRMGLVARSLMAEVDNIALQPGFTQGQRDHIDWRLDCVERGSDAGGVQLMHLRLTLRQGSYEEVFNTLRVRGQLR
ncbi:prepilin-type N-terminal cleavage/methylation domain-containing protein [Pseudomonas capsici]|uniref:prepilin-type N-terminal cleavage/methylation domain-containing protein n=1 Tax=Pseudomonas capsici TaxID=2810614 RepID=UPI000E3E9DC5|nr:prepilin-type N-terminal cleavage/methylation domain-containing protein [Pseudomonas capsici]MCV4286462.1 prepilin-type N-terminal cleavage/methylation domain-containing protein [Pseudomonas capsici]